MQSPPCGHGVCVWVAELGGPGLNDSRSAHAFPAEVLVVDDNPDNLLAIEAALGDIAPLVTARSGREALRLLLERDFSCILLDVHMPGVSGIETAKLIRERERTKYLPIIFVTAFSHDDDLIAEAYRLGAVDFLFKPIQTEVLRSKTAVFVELARRNTELARQAEKLREGERAAHRHQLEQQRHHLEQLALRARIEEQQAFASEQAARARDLARIAAEREEAERALQRTNKQLELADKAKDEFLAMLAHELRNPLTPLVSGIEILRTFDIPGIAKTRDAMGRQLSHLVRLVDDLLDVSRITTRAIELRCSPVSLGVIVEQAVEHVQPLLERRQHQLTVSVPAVAPVVLGDEVRLTQIVSNLLSNAIRYTDPPGHIEIEVGSANAQTKIEVRDNGRGLSGEQMGSVFQLFGRCGDGNGLGVGLTLARTLTEQHGGSLSVSSKGRGKGSTFTVSLPLFHDSDADALVCADDTDVAVVAPSLPSQPSLKVAVIDDDDDVREVTSELLSIWGYRVEAASTGRAGVDLVLKMRPDVAIVDIGLPDLDGYQVARELRGALAGDTPRLVAMSGYAQPEDRRKSAAAGFDAHIAKPPDSGLLRQAIHARKIV